MEALSEIPQGKESNQIEQILAFFGLVKKRGK